MKLKIAVKEIKKGRDRRYKKKASVTVEAALLMPLILGSILFVIYMGFYLHDGCMLQRAAECAVLRAGNERDEEVGEGAARQALSEILDRKTIEFWDTTSEVDISSDRVETKVSGVMKYNNYLLSGAPASANGVVFSIREVSPRFDGGAYIRAVKKRGTGYAATRAD